MFTYDLSTTVGLVRFHIGDTVEGEGLRPNKKNFSDEEITAAVSQGGGTVGGGVSVLQSILANEWSSIPDLRVGQRSEKTSGVATRFRDASAAAGGTGTYRTFASGFVRRDGYSDDPE